MVEVGGSGSAKWVEMRMLSERREKDGKRREIKEERKRSEG